MNTIEIDNDLNIDSFMNSPNSMDYNLDYSEDDTNYSFCSQNILQNKKISFGFFEQSNSNFYEIFTYENQSITIKHEKYFQISLDRLEKNTKCIYNVVENYPALFKIINLNNLNLKIEKKNDIIISFDYPPKFCDEKEEIPSHYLIENYNKDNNLRCFDCPFRNILIKEVNERELLEIKNKVFFIHREKEKEIKNLNIYNSNIFFSNISKLKDTINKENNNDFYSNYITYVNISENLLKNKYESVISIYENYRNFFKNKKFSSDKKKDKNSNLFFIIKHIYITPSRIIIKKEIFHQSSRFLRLYYNNNNFIKVEFKSDNNTQLLSTTDYKNFNKFSKISLIYDLIFKQGINLCGIQYSFFLNPTNCMKSNSIWLLEEKESNLKKDYYYNDLGSNELFNNSNLSFSKILSRFSQNFTSTISYNFPFEYEIIADKKTPDGKYIFNDGCGLISKELLIDICNKLNKGNFSSAIQIRFKGAKGVLVVDEKIKGKKILFSESMFKFNCNNCNDLEICRFSKSSPGFLNLQIIILLILSGIKKNVIYSIAKKEVLNYRNYHKLSQNLSKDEMFNQILKDIEKQNKILNVQKDYMSKIAKSTYIYNRLSSISKKYRFHMKNCTFLIGVCDFNNILEENEVFVQLYNENKKKRKIIIGDIIITKNPCLSRFDLHKVKAVYKEEFKDLYYNIIIFPSKGDIPIPCKITGSDLDGDIYWICWDKKLINIETKDYSNRFIQLKNEEEIPEKLNLRYHTGKNGEKIRNIYIKINTIDYNKTRDINNKNLPFNERCLDFHKFFHSNYKLHEINRCYLSKINELLENNNNSKIEFFDHEKLEKFAFYHSIEVDFQKTGETSDFIGENNSPFFLRKNELRKKSNCLIKLKEIHDEFLKNKNNNNYDFYDYFIQCSKEVDIYHNNKNLTFFERQKKNKANFEKSFIYKLYELVSLMNPMKDSFIDSIYLISEEYFYDNKIFKEKKFSQFNCKDLNLFKEILIKVKNIVLNYENEIKNIMIENEISIEIELLYLTDLLEPKIPVFKNDIEDYRINLNFQINYYIQNSIFKFNELKKNYQFLTKENIEDMIFIIIFWAMGNKIIINNIAINIDDIIKRNYIIKSKRNFINDLVHQKNYDQMKYFFYENIKSFTIYNFYCKNN